MYKYSIQTNVQIQIILVNLNNLFYAEDFCKDFRKKKTKFSQYCPFRIYHDGFDPRPSLAGSQHARQELTKL